MAIESANGAGMRPPRVSHCLAPEIVLPLLGDRLTLPEPWRLDRVGVVRFWPHKRGRYAVEYNIELIGAGGETRTVRLQGRFQHPVAVKDRRAYARDCGQAIVANDGLMGVGLVVDELSMVLHSPDRDRRMPWLARALNPARMAEVLGESRAGAFIGDGEHADGIISDIVGYRAGRRCTLRCRGRDTVFAKTFRDDRARGIARTHNDLADFFRDADDGRIAIPRCLDVIDEFNMVILEARERSESPAEVGETVARRAAEVLSVLHRATPMGEDTHTPEDELRILRRWCDTFDALDAPSTAAFRRGVEKVSALAGGVVSPSWSLVHRDFHDGQLLIAGECVTLVDLDTVTRGHVEVDLATYVAHLLLAGMDRIVPSRDGDREARRFLDEYERHGGRYDQSRLRYYLGSALLRLGAIQFFRRPRERGADPLWAAAVDRLDQP